jgi:predicted XRE-type DNA-binding protein
MTHDHDLKLGEGGIKKLPYLERPYPEARQLKAVLAGEVLKVLDQSGITTYRAQELTGFDRGDFSRVRRSKLDRFTIERLIAMLERLGQEVKVSVHVHPRMPGAELGVGQSDRG